MLRAAGGALYLGGALVMVYNVARTIGQGSAAVPEPDAPPADAVAVAGGQ